MGASAGYGQAVHSGKCAMHKLGIQVLPSPDMIAIMDAKGTLCKVTLLSIRSEDMLANYTANEFATGFKKRPAFQLRGIKQNRGSSCEGMWISKRQPGSSCPSPVVMVFMGSKDMLCRVSISNIGWEDALAPFTINESATSFKKPLAFQPHGIKQSRGPSGEGIWTTKRQPGSPCTSPDVMLFMGSKDILCKVAMLNIGVEMVWRTRSHTSPWRLASRRRRLFSCAESSRQRLVRQGHLDHHAPHRGHTLAVKQAWWATVAQVCHSLSKGATWLLLFDANCRVGNRTTSSVGDHQPDFEDESAQLFHDLLLSLQVWLPSTFPEVMHGDGGTLVQKRSGAVDRSDFIGLPSSWRQGLCTAYVEPSMCADHYVVTMPRLF